VSGTHFLHSSFLAVDRRIETWPMDLILIRSWSHFNCRLNLLQRARSSASVFVRAHFEPRLTSEREHLAL